MKIIKTAILLSVLMSSLAIANKLPEGWWAKGSQVSGTVSSFEKFPLSKDIPMVVVKLDQIDIPKPYDKDTTNCRAYMDEMNSKWSFINILCDYKKDEIVRLIYSASIDVPPLNLGDRITFTNRDDLAIAGAFMAFKYKRSELKPYW